jgi:glutamine amidotransferase
VTASGPRLAVLDYGIGNLRSAEKALQRQGADARLTADPTEIEAADGLVLPGVGHFGACMRALVDRGLDVVAAAAIQAGRPFLGICVGAQMLFDGSEEEPDTPGIGVVPGFNRRLPEGEKHPQMQWNRLEVLRPSAMLDGLDHPIWMYFVHSYAPVPDASVAESAIVATCDYGGPVVAAVEYGSVWATQFHPEKSSEAGLALLGNFVASVGVPA